MLRIHLQLNLKIKLSTHDWIMSKMIILLIRRKYNIKWELYKMEHKFGFRAIELEEESLIYRYNG